MTKAWRSPAGEQLTTEATEIERCKESYREWLANGAHDYGVREFLRIGYLDAEARGNYRRGKTIRVDSSHHDPEMGHIARAIMVGQLDIRWGTHRDKVLRAWSQDAKQDWIWTPKNRTHIYWAEKHVLKAMRRFGFKRPKVPFSTREMAKRVSFVGVVLRAHDLNTGRREEGHEGARAMETMGAA